MKNAFPPQKSNSDFLSDEEGNILSSKYSLSGLFLFNSRMKLLPQHFYGGV